MAKRKNPEQLRAEAEKLIVLAQQEERLRCQQIGELVAKLISTEFKGFDLEDFKKKTLAIWTR